MKLSQIFSIILIGFLFISCQKGDTSKILVKVGEVSLSVDEFQSMFPKEIWVNLNQAQKMKLLSRWIDQQVLYQAGVSKGLLDETVIQRKLQDFEYKLVGEQYLANELSDLPKPTKSQLELFYQKHSSYYLRKSTSWDFTTLKVKSGKLAWDLFKALKSTNFDKSMKWIKKNESYQVQSFQEKNAQGNCFYKTLKSLKENRISTPVQCGKTYILVFKRKTHKEGELLSFESVQSQLELDFMENQSKQLNKQILEKAIQQTQIIMNQDLLSETN